jgi:hypothetical protein
LRFFITGKADETPADYHMRVHVVPVSPEFIPADFHSRFVITVTVFQKSVPALGKQRERNT